MSNRILEGYLIVFIYLHIPNFHDYFIFCWKIVWNFNYIIFFITYKRNWHGAVPTKKYNNHKRLLLSFYFHNATIVKSSNLLYNKWWNCYSYQNSAYILLFFQKKKSGIIARFRLVLSEFKRINFYSPWNHEKTIGFLLVLGGKEVPY